jgi:hypothetical protein
MRRRNSVIPNIEGRREMRLVVNSVRKTQLGRPGLRGKNNIKMYLKGKEWKIVDSTELAHYKAQVQSLLKTVMNFKVP